MQKTGYAKDYAGLLVFLMRTFDVLLVAASGTASFYLLKPIKQFPEFSGWLPNHYLTAIAVACLLTGWWFPLMDAYRSWRGSEITTELRLIANAWIAAFIGLIVFIFFTKTADLYSRHWIALWFTVALVALAGARIGLRLTLKHLRRKKFNLRHVVLVGSASKCSEIKRKIDKAPWIGLEVIGFFGELDSPSTDGQPNHLGQPKDLIPFLAEKTVDQVWITLSLRDAEQIEAIAKDLEKMAVEVMLVPDLLGWRLLNRSVVQINGLPLINIAVSPIKGINRLVKWLEDKILATFFLLIASPLMVLIAIAVKLSSPGPVLYVQERVGWNGRPFKMLKFRSMPVNADTQQGKAIWGQAHNKNPTRIGLFLRNTSLDELPQFINVLKGDMSIVGPRPERPMFVEQFRHEIDGYMQKHLVKAGMTGWAQIHGLRGDTSLEKRIQYDLDYIEHWSFGLDLKIILLTIIRGLVGSNAK